MVKRRYERAVRSASPALVANADSIVCPDDEACDEKSDCGSYEYKHSPGVPDLAVERTRDVVLSVGCRGELLTAYGDKRISSDDDGDYPRNPNGPRGASGDPMMPSTPAPAAIQPTGTLRMSLPIC